MVLVPATMTLLGKWNWWMPGGSKSSTSELDELDATPTPTH